MNTSDLVRLLQLLVEKRGSQKAFAQELGVSTQYLNDILHRHKEPGKKVLLAMGLKRVISYEPLVTEKNVNQYLKLLKRS